MKHAIICLQEELRALEAGRRALAADITVSRAEAIRLRLQLAKEVRQVTEALELLQEAQAADGERLHWREIEPGRYVSSDWDKALFEPYAERKARRAQRVAQP